MKSYFGRTVAIDASMCLYQFLVAVRQAGGHGSLTNSEGEVTSHLQGFFHRTIGFMELGIKPVYVFDGAPPSMKGGELAKRKARRAKAEEELKTATQQGDAEAVEKFTRRLVHVTKDQNEDVKTLLRLMGVPVIEAPCEAEAQCAELSKAGKVYAVATEDMDALTFGTTRQLRHMLASKAKKMDIAEIEVQAVLEGLDVTMEQFIDLCILMGCDYTSTIRGLGPKTALKQIRLHKNIETIIAKHKDPSKIPPDFNHVGARGLFVEPIVDDAKDVRIKFSSVDEAGLRKFMCVDKGFAEKTITNGINRLKNSKKTGSQNRLEGFFKVERTQIKAKPKAKTVKGKRGKKKVVEAPPKKLTLQDGFGGFFNSTATKKTKTKTETASPAAAAEKRKKPSATKKTSSAKKVKKVYKRPKLTRFG
jgi:flap endonuclease-1